MVIRGCNGYIVVCLEGDLIEELKQVPYGEGKQRKPLIQKKKQWLQCWNIITFFLQSHFNQKRMKNPRWDTFYINVHSKVLEKKFGDPWNKFQPILIDLGIIDKNPKYKTDGFTQSYRINKDIIHSEHLIVEDHAEDNQDRDYVSRVTLDVDNLLPQFDSITEERAKRKKAWSPFDKMMNLKIIKEFNFHDNPSVGTTGREFNKANNIPSEFRAFILIDGEETTEIDIKSSLPSILYKHTKGDEKARYGDLISQGRLYEFFADEMGITNNRKLAKKAFVHYLGGYREHHCKELGRTIKKHFPNLHQWMEDVENTHKQKHPDAKGGEVSRFLQKTESQIIVTMLEGIKEDDIYTISIHDGVRVKTQHTEIVKEAIERAFTLLVGIKPVLTVEEYDLNDKRSEIEKSFDEALANTRMLEWNMKDWD